MIEQEILYPNLKRSRPVLKTGTYLTVIESIAESKHKKTGEPCINVVFSNKDGYITLFMPMRKEAIFVLNKIAGMINAPENYRISDIVGATLNINVRYNKVVKAFI